MPWVKIDDQMPEHEKLVNAGPLAMALDFAGICYCNRLLTDGFVPGAQVPKLLNLEGYSFAGRRVTWRFLVEALIREGRWEEVEGGYQIHDYGIYQPTKDQVMAEREQKREAGRKGGQASAQARAKAGGQAGASAGAQAESNPRTRSHAGSDPQTSSSDRATDGPPPTPDALDGDKPSAPYWEQIRDEHPEEALMHEATGATERDGQVFSLLGRLRSLHNAEIVRSAVSDLVAKQTSSEPCRSPDHARRYVVDRCKAYASKSRASPVGRGDAVDPDELRRRREAMLRDDATTPA